MRRLASLAILAGVILGWSVTPAAHAQGRGGPGGGGQGQQQDDDDAKTKKRNEEWGENGKNLTLPQLRNAGPCPYVKVLYDAARYVEMTGKTSASSVGFTGEIENLSSACEYKNDQPIAVQARLLFELGRGPMADGQRKTYRYWIAVTDRNRGVLAKQYFDLPVTFTPGTDRMEKIEDITGIVIPRKDLKVSGANFEVLIGFDVTPEMAQFNRDGERFRVNAGETQASSARP
jgi:hypothetical protein